MRKQELLPLVRLGIIALGRPLGATFRAGDGSGGGDGWRGDGLGGDRLGGDGWRGDGWRGDGWRGNKLP
jgi:hypothetical protein